MRLHLTADTSAAVALRATTRRVIAASSSAIVLFPMSVSGGWVAYVQNPSYYRQTGAFVQPVRHTFQRSPCWLVARAKCRCMADGRSLTNSAHLFFMRYPVSQGHSTWIES